MSQAVITLIILAVAIVLFVSDKLPMGLVAFMVPVALYFTGIIEADDIFTCVINSNVILILGEWHYVRSCVQQWNSCGSFTDRNGNCSRK